MKSKGIDGGDLDNIAVLTSDGRYVKTIIDENAEPYTEIVIRVGELFTGI